MLVDEHLLDSGVVIPLDAEPNNLDLSCPALVSFAIEVDVDAIESASSTSTSGGRSGGGRCPHRSATVESDALWTAYAVCKHEGPPVGRLRRQARAALRGEAARRVLDVAGEARRHENGAHVRRWQERWRRTDSVGGGARGSRFGGLAAEHLRQCGVHQPRAPCRAERRCGGILRRAAGEYTPQAMAEEAGVSVRTIYRVIEDEDAANTGGGGTHDP